MATDLMWTPEFDTVIKSHIFGTEEWLKQFELSRKSAVASAAKTKQEREKCLNYSEAFAYIVTVENGEVSWERIPGKSEDETENSIIQETLTMAATLLPDELRIAMGSAKEELAQLAMPYVKDMVMNELGGAFT
jgi:hypothetical protein